MFARRWRGSLYKKEQMRRSLGNRNSITFSQFTLLTSLIAFKLCILIYSFYYSIILFYSILFSILLLFILYTSLFYEELFSASGTGSCRHRSGRSELSRKRFVFSSQGFEEEINGGNKFGTIRKECIETRNLLR